MDKLINQDNKNYKFSPGSNGSLTAKSNMESKPDLFNRQHVSRVVPALKNMRKKKQEAVQVASARD